MNNVRELNMFAAGWCASAAISCLVTESYVLAALNIFLVFFNIKMAQENK